MSQNYYKLYLESVMKLAETLVIKSEYTALRINELMLLSHGKDSFDSHNPRTWKYYLNVSGEYHATDTVIKIISLDTLQEISFTKANLAIHKSTADAYQYGSRYYRELIFRYPEQEELILGILYPVDIEVAISAPDFSVLSYPKYLIEDNELSLVIKINEWLENFDIRWNNKQYTIVDDWYGAATIAVMYAQLVPLILNLRLRACKTSEAHSFHVREYLASHGMLDIYLAKMTKKQALFFYRNICYIERNAGKQDTFHWLVEKIMTDRGLPLSEYTAYQSEEGLATNLKPKIYFKKKLINDDRIVNSEPEIEYDTRNVLNKEAKLASGNIDYSNNNLNNIEKLFQSSLSGKLSTKLLESSMIDYTDAVPHTLHQVFLNQWIKFTNTNRFNTTYIRIKSPRTGKELLLNTSDAYIYYLYAFAKTAGVTLSYIPPLFSMRTRREPMPDADDLMSVVSPKYIPQAYAHRVIGMMNSIGTIQTIDDFRKTCLDIHRSSMEQMYFIYQQENLTTRGMTYNMVHRLYEDTWFASPDPITGYEAWMSFRNLEHQELDIHDWQKVYISIYETITGVDMSSTENIVGVQKAMVALLTQLSSYTIQIVSDVNTQAIKTPNWNTVRVEQVQGISRTYQEILLGIFKIFKKVIKPKDRLALKLDYLFRNFKIHNKPTNGGFIDIPIDVIPSKVVPKTHSVLDLGIFRLNQETLPLPQTSNSYADWPNYAAFAAMTPEEIAFVKDIYCDCPKVVIYPTKADIEDLILYEGLTGFKYQPIHRDYLGIFNYYYLPDTTYNFQLNDKPIELDAFYPNLEPQWLDNFNLNTKPEHVNNFKLFDQMPLENPMPHFKQTAGWEYLSVFSPARMDSDEYSLPGMKTSYDSKDMPSMDITTVSVQLPKLINNANIFTAPKAIYVYANAEFTINAKYFKDNLVPALKGNHSVVSFSFNNTISVNTLPDLAYSPMTGADITAGFETLFFQHTIDGFVSETITHQIPVDINYSGIIVSDYPDTNYYTDSGVWTDMNTTLYTDLKTLEDLVSTNGKYQISGIENRYFSGDLSNALITEVASQVNLAASKSVVDTSTLSDAEYVQGTGIVWS